MDSTSYCTQHDVITRAPGTQLAGCQATCRMNYLLIKSCILLYPGIYHMCFDICFDEVMWYMNDVKRIKQDTRRFRDLHSSDTFVFGLPWMWCHGYDGFGAGDLCIHQRSTQRDHSQNTMTVYLCVTLYCYLNTNLFR